ncbi:MAG: AbrB/MazE/SpoVT family DNA-binding domain-containing protein [Solirubrobacterales bacterium]
MGQQGRIVIPAEFRRELEMEPGARLVFRVEDDHLVVEKAAAVEARIRARFQGKGGDVVESLLAERRREAERDDRREAGWERRRKIQQES